MKWHRTQVALRHMLDFGGGSSIETMAYRHDFDRTWRKVNRLGSANIADVLRDPDQRPQPAALPGAHPGAGRLAGRGHLDRPQPPHLRLPGGDQPWASCASAARAVPAAGGRAPACTTTAIERRHSEEPFLVQGGGPGARPR